MKRVLVIADDLSGAAEISGIGQRYGLPTRLLREPCEDLQSGLTVFDTDSRSLEPDAAAARVQEFIRPHRWDAFDFVYKKTDSAMRGPIVPELHALLDHFELNGALLLPQNPSRGRTIEGFDYLIDGVPIDRTHFAHDPEYPA